MFDYDLYSGMQIQPESTLASNGLIIEVAGGGEIIIVGDFNLFLLDEQDRELIDAIALAVRKHKEAKPPKPPLPDLFQVGPSAEILNADNIQQEDGQDV
jgi:hypothetical protein